jgi:hypothetical protein
MAIYKHVSSKEILRKVFRDLHPPEANWIHDAIEWIGEALEHIGASSQLCKKQALIPINNHTGYLPGDLYYINQVAINTCVAPSVHGQVEVLQNEIDELNANLSTYYQQVTSAVTLSANGTYNSSLVPEDLQNMDSYHATTLNKLRDINSQLAVLQNTFFSGGNCLQPLSYSSSTFHASMHCEDCRSSNYKDSYIVNCGSIKTSFQTGQICISYMAFPTDDECYPMVPDNISYREAMFWYITKKLLLGGTNLPNTQLNYQYADAMWQNYCTQARNAANYPDIDRYQSFMDQWVRLTPNLNRDLNFFDDLNTREQFAPDNY